MNIGMLTNLHHTCVGRYGCISNLARSWEIHLFLNKWCTGILGGTRLSAFPELSARFTFIRH